MPGLSSRLPACLAVVLLLAAACGPLPRPFQPTGKGLANLRALDLQSRVVVLPLKADLDADQRQAAAETLAEALRGLEVPATTGGDPRLSRRLIGRAVVQRVSFREDEVLLYWELEEPDGRRIGSYSQRNLLPHGVWQAALPEGLVQVMGDAARPLADLMRPPPPQEAPIPGFPGASLVLLPMDALPGDGPTSLKAALARELAAEGVPLSEEIGDQDLLVFGDVALGPDRDGVQEIRIVWYVIRARDSEELGQISQGNRIPTGALSGPWGPTAGAVAKGAAVGILDLLGKVGRGEG